MAHKEYQSDHVRKQAAFHDKPGALPTLAPIDPLYVPNAINVIGYGPKDCREASFHQVSDLKNFSADWPVTWIDVDGLGNTEFILQLGDMFGINKLALEDIFEVTHQPKIEEYDNYILIIMKNGVRGTRLGTEHIALILTDKVVITFQEQPGDSFNQIRERIRQGIGKIRQFGPDFLTYALIDAVVEGYYPILNDIKCRLEDLDDCFITMNQGAIEQIHKVKRDLLVLHSAIWPIHDITMVLSHEDIPFMNTETTHYLRDCQDQAKQVKDLSEFYRMNANDLMSTYLAYNDSKANEVMKVLTMVATIFIPLNFIASFYGMNFENMPELKSRYGYQVISLLMLCIMLAELYMFKRRGWFGKPRGARKSTKLND